MKKIHISEITAEGFRSLSTRSTVILDRPGLNLVKGVNGAGKTTLFEALVWCLYGINLKETAAEKVQTWSETRTPSFQGTYVEVTFAVNDQWYSIVRTIGWSGGEGVGRDSLNLFEITKDKKNMITDGVHKRPAQDQIIQLLGIDSVTFMSSVLFGQRLPKLVESDNKDKRDLFEKLFETSFIASAKAEASAKIKELDGQAIKFDAEVHNKTIQIDNIKRDIEEQNRILGEFDNTKVMNISRVKQNIKDTEAELPEIQGNIDEAKGFIEAWDPKEYDRLKTEYDVIDDKYKALEPKRKAIDELLQQHELAVGKASQADVLAETNVNLQIKRDEQWVIDKAGAIADLKEELANLLNKKTDKLNDVAQVCYACGQDLSPENVEAVKASIEADFAPQLESVNTRLGNKQVELPPPSNLPELKNNKKAAEKELESAKRALEKIQAEKVKFLKDNEDITQQWEKMLKDEEKLDIGAMDVKSAKEDIKGWESDIQIVKERLAFQNESLKQYQNSEPPKFDYTVEDLYIKLGTLDVDKEKAQDQADEINREIQLYEWWIKKGFSAAGLPAFIFRAMLETLNENVIKYGDRLGVSIEFTVDLTKATKPFTTVCSLGDKIDKEYKEFSGGQKQRLDIVLIFAMHDLVSAGVDINLMIMDEVFEGLDEAGEAAVFDLVRVKAEEGKSIYIITHSPHIDSLYSSTMTALADENGATKIEG